MSDRQRIARIRADYDRMLEVVPWPRYPTWERYLYLVERETQWHREQAARNKAAGPTNTEGK